MSDIGNTLPVEQLPSTSTNNPSTSVSAPTTTIPHPYDSPQSTTSRTDFSNNGYIPHVPTSYPAPYPTQVFNPQFTQGMQQGMHVQGMPVMGNMPPMQGMFPGMNPMAFQNSQQMGYDPTQGMTPQQYSAFSQMMYQQMFGNQYFANPTSVGLTTSAIPTYPVPASIPSYPGDNRADNRTPPNVNVPLSPSAIMSPTMGPTNLQFTAAFQPSFQQSSNQTTISQAPPYPLPTSPDHSPPSQSVDLHSQQLATFAQKVLDHLVDLVESMEEAIYVATEVLNSGDRSNVLSVTHFAATSILDGLGFVEIVLLCSNMDGPANTAAASQQAPALVVKKAHDLQKTLLDKLSLLIQYVTQYQTVMEDPPEEVDQVTINETLADLDGLILNELGGFESGIKELNTHIISIFSRQTLAIISWKVFSKDPEAMRAKLKRSDASTASITVRLSARLSQIVYSVLETLRNVNDTLRQNKKNQNLKSATSLFMTASYELLSIADTFFAQLEKIARSASISTIVSPAGIVILNRTRTQYPVSLKSVADRAFKIAFAAQTVYQSPSADSRRQLKIAALGYEDALQQMMALAMETSSCLQGNETPTGSSPTASINTLLDRLNMSDEEEKTHTGGLGGLAGTKIEINPTLARTWNAKLDALSFAEEDRTLKYLKDPRLGKEENRGKHDVAPSIQEIIVRKRLQLHGLSRLLGSSLNEVFNSVITASHEHNGTEVFPFSTSMVRKAVSNTISVVGKLESELDQILIVLAATSATGDPIADRGPRTIIQREITRLQDVLEQVLHQKPPTDPNGNIVVLDLQMATKPILGAVTIAVTLVKYVDGLLARQLDMESDDGNESLNKMPVDDIGLVNLQRPDSGGSVVAGSVMSVSVAPDGVSVLSGYEDYSDIYSETHEKSGLNLASSLKWQLKKIGRSSNNSIASKESTGSKQSDKYKKKQEKEESLEDFNVFQSRTAPIFNKKKSGSNASNTPPASPIPVLIRSSGSRSSDNTVTNKRRSLDSEISTTSSASQAGKKKAYKAEFKRSDNSVLSLPSLASSDSSTRSSIDALDIQVPKPHGPALGNQPPPYSSSIQQKMMQQTSQNAINLYNKMLDDPVSPSSSSSSHRSKPSRGDTNPIHLYHEMMSSPSPPESLVSGSKPKSKTSGSEEIFTNNKHVGGIKLFGGWKKPADSKPPKEALDDIRHYQSRTAPIRR
ncbi:hypothetical protein HK098_000070 [Nowakowskiella sp. JEL0407]|nr:hypothetical protein HK098_000060 [Nowakowskiella sp. JEL0407]KAJ3130505.1 hypothetical protein HK098_000070 [Nowakowskiella sp. JEL0407]